MNVTFIRRTMKFVISKKSFISFFLLMKRILWCIQISRLSKTRRFGEFERARNNVSALSNIVEVTILISLLHHRLVIRMIAGSRMLPRTHMILRMRTGRQLPSTIAAKPFLHCDHQYRIEQVRTYFIDLALLLRSVHLITFLCLPTAFSVYLSAAKEKRIFWKIFR